MFRDSNTWCFSLRFPTPSLKYSLILGAPLLFYPLISTSNFSKSSPSPASIILSCRGVPLSVALHVDDALAVASTLNCFAVSAWAQTSVPSFFTMVKEMLTCSGIDSATRASQESSSQGVGTIKEPTITCLPLLYACLTVTISCSERGMLEVAIVPSSPGTVSRVNHQ